MRKLRKLTKEETAKRTEISELRLKIVRLRELKDAIGDRLMSMDSLYNNALHKCNHVDSKPIKLSETLYTTKCRVCNQFYSYRSHT